MQFEDIANKAWQLGKFISYYIAKQNIKSLRNLLYWAGSDLRSVNKKSIVEKIDDLDLDKLIFQIPNLDNEQYNLLKIIRDDEILLKAESKINEFYEKVVDVYNLYEKGGSTSGPYYPELIVLQLNRIYLFYTYNYIVKDEYSEFKKIFRKAIKALLICHAIKDEYPEKLRKFDLWTIKLIILYGDDSAMLKIIKEEYELKELQVEEDDIQQTISYFNNLLKSFTHESKFAKKNVVSDNNIVTQTKNFLFQTKIRDILHNALLIFSRIKIPQEAGKEVAKNFLDFLSTENILVGYSSQYLNEFLFYIKDFFSIEDYIEVLEISLDSKGNYVNKPFYRVISSGLQKRFPDYRISDEDLISSIILKSIDKKRHKHERGFMYLWKVCSFNNKKLIEDALRDDLHYRFFHFDYLEICFEDVLDESEFYDNYIETMEAHIPLDIQWKDDKPKYDDITFFNFANMLYYKNKLNDAIPFKRFEEYPLFWKFYFKPFDFNYEHFNPKWLLYIDRVHVHQTLNKIPLIKLSIENFLKNSYHEDLSKIYVQNYL